MGLELLRQQRPHRWQEHWGRRWGVRQSMLVGLIISIVGGLLFPLADLLPPSLTIMWLVSTNVIAHAGAMLFYVNLTPYLGAFTDPSDRRMAFSIRFALQWLGASLGSVIGGLLPGLFAWVAGTSLEHPAPYRNALILGTVLLLAAIPVLLRSEEVNTGSGGGRKLKASPTPWELLRLVALVSFMITPAEAAAWMFFNVYVDTVLNVPTPQIGLTIAAAQILGVPVALTTPVIGSRIGTGRAAVWATLGIGMSLIPLALIPHFAVAALGFVGVLVFGSILAPALNIFLTELTSAEWLGSATGASLAGTTSSFALVSLGGGFMIQTLGYTGFFLMAAMITGFGALIFNETLVKAKRRVSP